MQQIKIFRDVSELGIAADIYRIVEVLEVNMHYTFLQGSRGDELEKLIQFVDDLLIELRAFTKDDCFT